MYIGDLVRVYRASTHDNKDDNIGIVISMVTAWPEDAHDETMTAYILQFDGEIVGWYDWQLEVISDCHLLMPDDLRGNEL
jgi:hypothetical protein